MELDPKFRFRPWQAALLAVLVVTGLVFVFAPELPTARGRVLRSSLPRRRLRCPSSRRTGTPRHPTRRRPCGPRGRSPRRAALRARRRVQPETTCVPQSSDVSLSVLSFNTHSAHGRDGLDVEQIAREIAAWDPDIVLLQEVDRNRASSRRTDQPGFYAQRLGMHMAFGVNQSPPGQRRVRRRDPVEVPHRRDLEHAPAQRPEPPEDAAARPPVHEDQGRGHPDQRLQHPPAAHLRRPPAPPDATSSRTSCAADPLPKIMGGDLNSGPRTPVLAAARSVLRDPWDCRSGVGSGATAPAAHPRGTDRLRPVLRPAGPRRLAGVLLAGLRPPRRPQHVHAQRRGRTNLRAGLRRTLGVVPPRLRSHGSRQGTHPRGPHGVTN